MDDNFFFRDKNTVRCFQLTFFFLFFTFYCILLGRILQLPRGKGHKRTSRSYSKVPHLTHPPIRIRKTATAPGSPYSFRIVRGFFYVPQNYQHSRNCETGPPTYRRTHNLPRHSPVHNQVSYRCASKHQIKSNIARP